MNLSKLSVIIAVAKIAEPLITDLEAIVKEVESNDDLKTKVQNVGKQVESLIETLIAAV